MEDKEKQSEDFMENQIFQYSIKCVKCLNLL